MHNKRIIIGFLFLGQLASAGVTSITSDQPPENYPKPTESHISPSSSAVLVGVQTPQEDLAKKVDSLFTAIQNNPNRWQEYGQQLEAIAKRAPTDEGVLKRMVEELHRRTTLGSDSATKALIVTKNRHVVDLLVALLNSETEGRNTDNDYHFADILSSFKDDQTIDAVLTLLDNHDYPGTKRKIAIQALGYIGNAKAIDPLIKVLKTEGSLIDDAGSALGIIHSTQTTSRLLEVLQKGKKDDFESFRQIAIIRALGTLADPQAIETLMGLLRSSNKTISIEAAFALLNYNSTEALQASLAYFVKNNNPADFYGRDLKEDLDRISDKENVIRNLMSQIGNAKFRLFIEAIFSNIETPFHTHETPPLFKLQRSLLFARYKDPDPAIRKGAILLSKSMLTEDDLPRLVSRLADPTVHTEVTSILKEYVRYQDPYFTKQLLKALKAAATQNSDIELKKAARAFLKTIRTTK